MHKENLKFLYQEYKNCLKQQFAQYFEKDNEFRSYTFKCQEQKNLIYNYYGSFLEKIYENNPDFEEVQEDEILIKYPILSHYGWSEKQIRN
jgi:hypothetical protein